MLMWLKVTRRMCSLTRAGPKAKGIFPRMLSSPVGEPKSILLPRLISPVMLRVLEYFKGILIMTTNRVMTFDVAMLSRCHYAVNFKSLTLQQEKDIWQGYFRQLTDQNSAGRPEIQTWLNQITKKRTRLSGREIRNLFTTAPTLAQAEPSKKIMKKHLERVYDRLMEFSEEMEKSKTTQQALLNASYS